jgi:hypothetical protein
MLLNSQLIDESDVAAQPLPAIQVLGLKPLYYRTVLAQAGKINCPNNGYKSQGFTGNLGKYQFNSVNLELLGYLKAGSLAKRQSQAGANALTINEAANWTGKNGSNSASDFLTNSGEQEAAIQALWYYNANWLTGNTSFFTTATVGQQVGFLLVAQIASVQAVVRFNDFLMGRNVDGNLADYTGRFTLLDYFQAGQLASDFGASVQIA